MIFRKFFFFFFFFLLACESEQAGQIVYSFPPLSQGQLVDLKKQSEKMEGFFITTDLSDLDPSWAENGFYVYVCIRFLNDKEVNKKLKKSAIPLLVQVSTNKNEPEAESVLLLHPQSNGSGDQLTLYNKETRSFDLANASMRIKEKDYDIFDINFNSKSKISILSFLKSGTSLEQLEAASVEDDEYDDDEYDDEEEDEYHDEEAAPEEPVLKRKDLVLTVTSFAKQHSSSCKKWSRMNFNHEDSLPEYLKIQYSGTPNTGTALPTTSSSESSVYVRIKPKPDPNLANSEPTPTEPTPQSTSQLPPTSQPPPTSQQPVPQNSAQWITEDAPYKPVPQGQ